MMHVVLHDTHVGLQACPPSRSFHPQTTFRKVVVLQCCEQYGINQLNLVPWVSENMLYSAHTYILYMPTYIMLTLMKFIIFNSWATKATFKQWSKTKSMLTSHTIVGCKQGRTTSSWLVNAILDKLIFNIQKRGSERKIY